MGVKIPDLGNQHPCLGAVQKKETKGDPMASSLKAGDFNYCLSSRLKLGKEVVIWRKNYFAHNYFTVRAQGHP